MGSNLLCEICMRNNTLKNIVKASKEGQFSLRRFTKKT